MSAPLHVLMRPGCDDRCRGLYHSPDAHYEAGYQDGYAAGLVGALAEIALVRTGPLVIDLGRRLVTVDGDEKQLTTGREWGLLDYVARRAGCWCDSREIFRAVWGTEWADANDDHVVTVNWTRLRGKLGAAGRLLETTRGGGTRRRLVLAEPTP